MATIKEMAELAFPIIAEEDKEAIEALKYVGVECDNIHEYNSVRLNQQYLYIIGANAVLKEIENSLNEGRANLTNPYVFLRDKIKQLRGE